MSIGTHFNGACCFDYGNAETSATDTGNGHMEAIYFGTETTWGTGSGSGPWIMADLENGLFSGLSAGENDADPTITDRFITAVVKGEPNQWYVLLPCKSLDSRRVTRAHQEHSTRCFLEAALTHNMTNGR